MKETTVTRRRLLGGAATAAAGGALLATPVGASAASQRRCRVPTPEDYTKFIVYLGQDLVSSPDPEVFIDTRRDVYGQGRSEVVALAEQAKRFFLERFGLDFFGVDGPTIAGPWEIDGAVLGTVVVVSTTYRAYIVSEDWVDPRGWRVRDSAFIFRLTKDMVLHGTWGGAAGIPVPAGSSAFTGDYNIKVDRPGRSERGEVILIHFDSSQPAGAFATDAVGSSHAICDLTHPDWGTGCACIVSRTNGAVRNVITFPASV
jgi:hypothetical protein